MDKLQFAQSKLSQQVTFNCAGSSTNRHACVAAYAVVISNDDESLIDEKSELIREDKVKCTSVRAALYAFLDALTLAKAGNTIVLADEHIVKVYNVYLDEWVADGWHKKGKGDISNLDLWKQIYKLKAKRPSVKVVHIRKDNRNHYQERASKLADQKRRLGQGEGV